LQRPVLITQRGDLGGHCDLRGRLGVQSGLDVPDLSPSFFQIGPTSPQIVLEVPSLPFPLGELTFDIVQLVPMFLTQGSDLLARRREVPAGFAFGVLGRLKQGL